MPRKLPNYCVLSAEEDYSGMPMNEIPLEVLITFNKEYRIEQNPTVKRVFKMEFNLVQKELKLRKNETVHLLK